MRRDIILGTALACFAANAAYAAPDRNYDVPAGSLSEALITFAGQAGVSVVVDDPAMRWIRVSGLKGRYSLRAGLRRLLRGTPYDFRLIDNSVVRIVSRAKAVRTKNPPKLLKPVRKSPRPSRKPVPVPERLPPVEIVVTASKTGSNLASYPASASVIDLTTADAVRFGSMGSDLLLRKLPNLSATHLGSGRNKIFIRGIADSSFNGTNQSTITQYFGETRLIYSAPDPDLALYDIARIEVIEGPQGTLYGAGSLGGIIRLVPNPPNLENASIGGGVGVAQVAHGAAGGDASIVANLPILNNRIGFRLLGYQIEDPGYINDSFRGLRNINHTSITGFRAAVRWAPSDDVTIDLGYLGQDITARDGQYSLRDAPPFTRRSRIAQPFDNDYRLGFATLRKSFGALELISNTAFARHGINSTYDASMQATAAQPITYVDDLNVSLFTHETRLSSKFGNRGNWLIGASLVNNVNDVTRLIGPAEAPALLAKFSNTTLDASLFGEATAFLINDISVTLGGRFSYGRQISQIDEAVQKTDFEPARKRTRFLPMGALAWHPTYGSILYLRYQEGFRSGSQQITTSGGELRADRFDPDEIGTTEFGFRFGGYRDARISGGVQVARSRWDDIQADLIAADGFPFIANIGSGRVQHVSANLAWRPIENMTVEGAGFLNGSHLDQPAPAFANTNEPDLPNIADAGLRVAARFDKTVSFGKLTLDGAVGYVGTSTLGIAAPLDLKQGGYIDSSAGVRLDFGGWAVSLDIQNLLDRQTNRFSFGNPFSVADGQQITPLRPRSIRIGLDAQF